MSAFAERHPGSEIARFDMSWLDSIKQRQNYDDAFGVPESRRLEVPALFVDGEAYIGADAIRDFVEDKSKPARNSLQRAADRYGPTALRWLLVAGLIAVAASSASGGRGQQFVRPAIRVLLGSLLVVSAATKGTHLQLTAQSFGEQWPLLSGLGVSLLAGVAAIEAIIGSALLLGRPRLLASGGALALFGVFLVYALAAQALRISGDCGCFPWRESLGWSTVARNTGLAVLSWSLVAMPAARVPSAEAEEPCAST